MQASMLLERNASLVPMQNIAILEEKLSADNWNLHGQFNDQLNDTYIYMCVCVCAGACIMINCEMMACLST